jgi:hypothetical protein
MEMAANLGTDIPQPVFGLKRGKGRSRVTNGSKLLPLADGRSVTARRFRDLYEEIGNDLGRLDKLSEGQKQLIKRAAMLSAECERMEAASVRGEPFSIDGYGMIVDRLGRLFQRIDLERRSRDITPTLQSYLEAKTKGAAGDGQP